MRDILGDLEYRVVLCTYIYIHRAERVQVEYHYGTRYQQPYNVLSAGPCNSILALELDSLGYMMSSAYLKHPNTMIGIAA